MKTTRENLVYSSFALICILAFCQGAPSRQPLNTYDQRQDGGTNVHAKLENFLFVVAPSLGPSGGTSFADLIPSDLLNLTIGKKNLASSVAHDNIDSKDDVDDDDDDETLKIVEVKPSSKKLQHEESEYQETTITRIRDPEMNLKKTDENESGIKIIAVIEKNIPIDVVASEQLSETNLKENEKEPIDETIDDKRLVEAEEKTTRTARDLKKSSIHSSGSKLSPVESAPPYENKVASAGTNEPASNVESSELQESQESRLIGDAIENCGPDSYRDRSGICRLKEHV